MRTNDLILYRNTEEGNVLCDMTFLFKNYDSEYYNREDLRGLLFTCVRALFEAGQSYGLEGNLWQAYLTLLLVTHENLYSRACEMTGAPKGSLNDIALLDLAIFRELFSCDFGEMERALDVGCLTVLRDFKGERLPGRACEITVSESILSLSRNLANAGDTLHFKEILTRFYEEFGVGRFGLNKAFRVKHGDGGGVEIAPITNIARVTLNDLVGYEAAKKKLTDNTEAFVEGRRANNCLLYGAAGTGKTSCVKAVLNKYYKKGLRMIEVYKHQFEDLNDVIDQIKDRSYKFIIFLDDLSFEEFETDYKYLKAVIEGGLEIRPDNVLIYATSNRRHLVRETFRDKADRDEELHTNDTVQEKLSLAARFGVSIYFGSPDKKEYRQIVTELALQKGIAMSEEELLLQADRWELSHGGRSGRTAQQFIDYLLWQEQKKGHV